MYGPYSNPLINPNIRKLFKPGKPVNHQATCPVCGRTLVNVYRHNSEWKCLECWKKTNTVEPEV